MRKSIARTLAASLAVPFVGTAGAALASAATRIGGGWNGMSFIG